MFSKINKLWNDFGFEILLVSSVVFIILYSLLRKITGKKGTWSKKKYYSIPPPLISSNYGYIKKSHGPPKESKGETECRRVLQYIFNKPFNKARPDFLRNPVTGGNFNLELDCFEEQLKLAVEYNGIQHYKMVPYFHKNKEAFLNQKYRDDMKNRMCKQHGITLIEVPYTVKLEDIKGFIEKELMKNGFTF